MNNEKLSNAYNQHLCGDFVSAISYYRALLEDDEDDPRLLYLYAVGLYDQLLGSISEEWLGKIFENDANGTQIKLKPYNLHAPCLLYAEALTLYDYLAFCSPKQIISILVPVFRASLATNNYDISNRLNKKIVLEYPEDYDAKIRLACGLLKDTDNEQLSFIERILRKSLEQNNSRPEAHLLLAIVFFKQDKQSWVDGAIASTGARLEQTGLKYLWFFRVLFQHGVIGKIGDAKLMNAFLQADANFAQLHFWVALYGFELGWLSYYPGYLSVRIALDTYKMKPKEPDCIRLAYRAFICCGDLNKAFELYQELETMALQGNARAIEIIACDRESFPKPQTPKQEKQGRRVLFYQTAGLGEQRETWLFMQEHKFNSPQDTIILYDSFDWKEHYDKPDFIDEWHSAGDYIHGGLNHFLRNELTNSTNCQPSSSLISSQVLLKDLEFDELIFSMASSPRKMNYSKVVYSCRKDLLNKLADTDRWHLNIHLKNEHKQNVQELLNRINPERKLFFGMQTRGNTTYGTLQLNTQEYISKMTDLAIALVEKYDAIIAVCGDNHLLDDSYYRNGRWIALDQIEANIYYKFEIMAKSDFYFGATSGFSCTVYYQRPQELCPPLEIFTTNDTFRNNSYYLNIRSRGIALYKDFYLNKLSTVENILDTIDKIMKMREVDLV